MLKNNPEGELQVLFFCLKAVGSVLFISTISTCFPSAPHPTLHNLQIRQNLISHYHLFDVSTCERQVFNLLLFFFSLSLPGFSWDLRILLFLFPLLCTAFINPLIISPWSANQLLFKIFQKKLEWANDPSTYHWRSCGKMPVAKHFNIQFSFRGKKNSTNLCSRDRCKRIVWP